MIGLSTEFKWDGPHVLRHAGVQLIVSEIGDDPDRLQRATWQSPEMIAEYAMTLEEREARYRKAVRSYEQNVASAGPHQQAAMNGTGRKREARRGSFWAD